MTNCRKTFATHMPDKLLFSLINLRQFKTNNLKLNKPIETAENRNLPTKEI